MLSAELIKKDKLKGAEAVPMHLLPLEFQVVRLF